MGAMAESILDYSVHSRLIASLDEVSALARVPKHFFHQSATNYCTAEELDWLVGFRQHRIKGDLGLCLTGKQSPSPEVKMMAMAAALVRNFLDARVVLVSELFSSDSKFIVASPTVMLVPNFYTVSEGKPLASWQLQQIHSVLLSRFVDHLSTILYVQSLPMMQQHYGDGIADHIQQNYKIVEG